MVDISPFVFLDAISYSKTDLIREGEVGEGVYDPFIINRSLSYFSDAIFDAQEMNRCYNLDPQMQFDYLRLSLRKMKRFSRWSKPSNSGDVKVISEAFGMNINKSREALRVLTDKQLIDIKLSLEKGGCKKQ